MTVLLVGALVPGIDCRRSIGAALGHNALTINPVDSDFGKSVAIGRDVVAVGMPGAWPSSVAGRAPGAVYLYASPRHGLRFRQKLLAPRDTVINQFGSRVTLSGDTLLVGAPLQPQLGGGHGALYVYERSGDRWRSTAELTIPGSRAQQGLGYASTVDGDCIAAAAPMAENDGVESGRVYVFRRSRGVWKRETALFRPEARAGDMFGNSVALAGDTLAIGSSPGSSLGAHLYVRQDGEWRWAKEIATGAGATVAMQDDLLAVAPTRYGHSSGAPIEVWLFRRTSGDWVEEARLRIDEGPPRDYIELGLSVADGRIAVHHSDRGELQLYERIQERWTRTGLHPIGKSLNRAVGIADRLLVAGASQPLSHSMGKRRRDASDAVGVPVVEASPRGMRTLAVLDPPDSGKVIWPF